MKKIAILISSVLLIIACGGTNQNEVLQEEISNDVDTNTISQEIAQGKKIKPIAKTSVSSFHELLQGKWQNVDDKTNYLIFDKNERKEISSSITIWETEAFVLSNKCLNESNKELSLELEKDKYISCLESDMCWYINEINSDILVLSYMGRGNFIEYKKVKNNQ